MKQSFSFFGWVSTGFLVSVIIVLLLILWSSRIFAQEEINSIEDLEVIEENGQLTQEMRNVMVSTVRSNTENISDITQGMVKLVDRMDNIVDKLDDIVGYLNMELHPNNDIRTFLTAYKKWIYLTVKACEGITTNCKEYDTGGTYLVQDAKIINTKYTWVAIDASSHIVVACLGAQCMVYDKFRLDSFHLLVLWHEGTVVIAPELSSYNLIVCSGSACSSYNLWQCNPPKASNNWNINVSCGGTNYVCRGVECKSW